MADAAQFAERDASEPQDFRRSLGRVDDGGRNGAGAVAAVEDDAEAVADLALDFGGAGRFGPSWRLALVPVMGAPTAWTRACGQGWSGEADGDGGAVSGDERGHVGIAGDDEGEGARPEALGEGVGGVGDVGGDFAELGFGRDEGGGRPGRGCGF